MEKIRKYAAEVGHRIVGNLRCRPEWDYRTDAMTGEKFRTKNRHYSDEAGNEYILGEAGGVVIVTADGGVI